MNTGEDEPSSGLNGRLRPRKSNDSPKTTKALRKLDAKPLNEKPKRTGTPSKASSNKPDDLLNKSESDVSSISQVLCSYCDKTFVSRQAARKHTRRVHISTSKQDSSIHCLFCNHAEIEPNDIIRHMVDSHPNQYFACLNCHSRFSSTSELAEHKLNVCEKQKPHYQNKLRQKTPKKTKSRKIDGRNELHTDDKDFPEDHRFNGIVISCELKPARVHDEADIEDNITTNLILPTSKNVGNATVIEKNAVIVLDDLQWNKRIPPNFNFHNTDADQILSRLGVVHRGPRTGEPNRRDWLKIIDETNQKFERCFDTAFYSKVASNVQENLSKFLDGSCNFNPDPDNTMKTRKSKNSVAINTAEGFPILLAFEQYSRNVFDGYMPRSIAPKHKWKWDNLEHEKTLLSPEQIKRDSHANNCIITLVSSLDIWTQLCMRQKFEDKFKSPLEKKAEKQSIIGKELKEILEKRELPPPTSQVANYVHPTSLKRDDLEFPASLGLAPATPNHDFKPAVLSGEWVRPRCYICCACGSQARDSRALSSHITTQHPNAQIQHYEIVGDVLLNSDISKHLYVPPSQVNNRTRPLRGYRECTKCKKSITLEDLHQHMLDCAGDTPAVRRKCRTARPFGVRKRRPRLPDNTIRKKIRKDIRSRHRKNLIRPRQKNRSEVGDAETIRKMLADLPAKRHRVLVNPLNSNLRPRRKFDKQRNIIKMKKISDDGNKKGQPHNSESNVNAGNEKLNKKVPNFKDSEVLRIEKSDIEQMPTIDRQNNDIKRKSPIDNNKRNLRFRESKDTNDGGKGKKCSDSGENTGGNESGNSGGNFNRQNPGEGSSNSREHGNRSDGNSNDRDNQQPGCSRQNDNSRDSSDQSPSVPLKHSIAQLTADTGTSDKSVQFHHLFLVQQECNNIPQHVPSRLKRLFENEAVVNKLDKPPLHLNHGGTMDPLGQKCKTNKPRKGLNDCIAMLKNKLVDPIQSSPPVSVQCEAPLTNNSKTNNANSYEQIQLPKKSTHKITHEIAVQCADLDDADTLADALLKELRRSQAMASTSQKDKGKGKSSKQRNDLLMNNDLNNHESIKNQAGKQKPTNVKELEAQPSTSGLQQSVSPGSTKGDPKRIKKSRDITPEPYAQPKPTSNQHSVPSDITKGSLKNIKKAQDNLPATSTYEIMESQKNCSIQQSVPSDSSNSRFTSTKKMESATTITQEKIGSKQSTTSDQQSVPSEFVEGSAKNIKKTQDNLPVSYTKEKYDTQENTTNVQQSVSSNKKAFLRNIKSSQNIIPATYAHIIPASIEIDSHKNITSSQQSVPSNKNKCSLKNIKKRQDSVPQTQEKSDTMQSTTSTQNSVSSNATKGSLKNIKKSQDTIPVTYTQEKMNIQQNSTTIQQCVPSDVTKMKNIKKNEDNIPVNNTQEKPNVSKNTNKKHYFDSSNATKSSLKNIKKCQDTNSITYTEETSDAQQNSSNSQQIVPTEVNKVSLKNDKKGQDINSVSYTQDISETQSVRQNIALNSVQQSDSSIMAKPQEIIPIRQPHEKSEIPQNTRSTQQSVPSNVAKSELKNIKKGLGTILTTHTQEKLDVQQSTYQKCVSHDGTKGSLKNIKKAQNTIPITYTEETSDAQQNSTSNQQIVPTEVIKGSLKNIIKGQDINSVSCTQDNSETQSVFHSSALHSVQQSDSSIMAKASMKNYDKPQDIIPIGGAYEKSEAPLNTRSTQQSVPSNVAKGDLKNIKKGLDIIPITHTQEKLDVPQATYQKCVSHDGTKGSLKKIKKAQNTIPITDTDETSIAQQNPTSNQQIIPTEVIKGSLKNIIKGQDINSVSYTQDNSETPSVFQSSSLHSVQQSDSSIIAKASMKNYDKPQDIIQIGRAHEKLEAPQNTSSTQQSVPPHVAKGDLKNIKKGLDIIPITHTQEKLDVQQCTTYQKSVSPDLPIGSLKNIRMIHDFPVAYTQSSNLDSSSEKYIDSISKNIEERKKSDSTSPNISNRAPERIDSKSSSPKQDVIRLEKENKVEFIQTKNQNDYDNRHLLVDHISTETVNQTLVTYEQHKIINVGSVNLKIDDNLYNLEPGPHDRTIQNLCQDMSVNEHSVINSDIQPAHCNVQLESMLTTPLDLSGKISSTQSDSPVSYPMPMYDNYETLDLSNKNCNRNVTQSNAFIDEDVVDLRIKYTSTMHFESDLSNTSSILDEATDLSLGNEQTPKDLSLRGRNRSLSRASNITNNECINIASGRTHYNSCSSDIYENACLDFSLKENMHTNNPTDLSGRRDNRIQHIDSNLSGIGSRIVEHNEMHDPDIATNLSVCNRMNLHASVNSINSYEPLHIITGEMTSHLNRHIVNPTILSTDIDIVSEDVFEPIPTVLHHRKNTRTEERDDPRVCPEIDIIDTGITLITSKDPTRDHFISVIANTSTYMDASVINQIPIYTKERVSPYPFTNTPLCLSETITTSLPAYNFKNRTLVTPSSKYESTTPVYTLANACISVTKIESTSSATLTNILLSIPGNTITNTTSVYTLAGTTIGTPINYNPGSNPLSINNEISFQTAANISESAYNPDVIDKPITIVSQEQEKVDDVRETRDERVGTNLDQDPDIAKKIALLPKELVEILGTMPLDHRKQLLNVLPQYVSTSTTTSGPSTDYSKEFIKKSNDHQVSSLPDRNNTRQSKVDVILDKRHNMLNPTPPPSTLPHSISQLSPSSVSSSFLLTPPTPNFKTRSLYTSHREYTASTQNSPEKDKTKLANDEVPHTKISTNTDLKVIDLCEPVIDLTGDDNSQSMPEGEVHTTSEASIQALSPKTVSSFPAVKGAALKINNDKTASLRAVRIKTQSERNKTTFPKSLTRKNSTEIPVISSNHDDTNISLDNNISLTIQQREITSTQHSNRNIITEDQISTSVSINNEQFEQKNGYDTHIGQNDCNILIEPKVVMENPNKVSLEIPERNKTEDTCSTNFLSDDIVYKETSSPVQPETIISNNNNVVSCKYVSELKSKTQEPDADPKQNRKISDDEDSDDDVSLAAIVKQRDSDKTVDKRDTQSVTKKIEKPKSNADRMVPSVEVTDMATDLISTKINNSDKLFSQLAKNTVDQCYNDKINIEAKEKNKKKGRKGRRSNNLNILKNVEQPTNDEFDINKENTVSSESENKKYKDENIKPKIIELDSACISPCNNSKETVCINQSYKENTELRDERKLVERDISVCDSSQADTSKSIDESNEQERVVLLTYDQTPIKNTTNKPKQDNLNRNDINLQKLPLIPRVVAKKIELKCPVNNIITDNTDTDVVNPNKKTTFTCTNESSCENLQLLNKIESTSMEQTTVTPLRRSRRGKSLFIDSNMTAKDSPSSSDIILEHKMPLTKKQLIFSKLLLDEEHNGPPVPSNIENIEKNYKAETEQIEQDIDHSGDGNGTVIQNDATDSEVDQQTCQSPNKTNKRKKTSQIRKKNKKKKLHEDSLLPNENTDLNQQRLVNDTMLKDSVKTLSTQNSSECLLETQHQEQILLGKSKEINKDVDLDSISSQEKSSQKKAVYIEKRKPDISTDIDSLASSKPKKSKGYDDIINEDEATCKKVLLTPDTTISDFKAKARTTTCYNKPVAARRARSKSVFVKSSVPDYYDPYDIDLEEMNEISETMNRKIALRKATYASKTPNSTVTSTSNKSEIHNRGLSECYDAVPSTSKDITISSVQLQKNEWLRGIDSKKLNTSTSLNKETISDSDDSSKSDIPLKKYVEEKEKKMVDSNENSNKHKNTNDLNTSGNTRTRKKNKRGSVINKKNDGNKTQSAENEAQLRSEQFMESFGFFSERKPRKSNLLATKKISETLHKIANETDDVYFGIKERSSKRSADKRNVEEDNNKGTTSKESKQDKKAAKRSRKKKSSTFIECTYCQICKKQFRRSDNYLRHQMSLLHISKLSEVELNVKTTPVEEQPNHLIAYKLQLDRVKLLHDKIAKRKMNSLPTNDIILPTIEEILANVKSTIREQQHYCRGLSTDEALFIDCCELLKESHNRNVRRTDRIRHCNSSNYTQLTANELEIFRRNIIDRIDNKSDGDLDSITARNIMESEEVRNLENDLISGLKEAANANKFNKNYVNIHLIEILSPRTLTEEPSCSLVNTNDNQVEKKNKLEESKVKPKRSPEYKEKMYPDIIENIDIFEDKFDKIKRKCRSQAAAASKQSQVVPEASSSHKVRKNKKKGKKKTKNHQSTVMTKGALKGFEGIKVSIVTTEINMSAIMPPLKKSSKKKKKNQSKKKREKKSTQMNTKTNVNDNDEPQKKKLDVYEFMDTDDAEVFDFRPSTIMERFKSISNKDIPSTSKNIGKYNEVEVSSDSASDGDDFVYMSDDYVCSEDETENSIMSCELRHVNETKKSSPFKRKDATEKSAVMGKIFKNNAVRSEKKIPKNKDIDKPKANLDQLFDSLLEEQPHSSKHISETVTSRSSEFSPQQYCKSPTPKQSNKPDFYEHDYDSHHYDKEIIFKKTTKLSTPDDTDVRSFNADRLISPSKKRQSVTPPKKCNLTNIISPLKVTNEDHIRNTNNKNKDSDMYSQLSLKKYDQPTSNDLVPKFSRRHDLTPSPESFEEPNDNFNYNAYKSKDKCQDKMKIKSSFKLHEKERRVSFDCHAESLDAMNLSDDGGVARQRVRRKCTVGKQNVLIETWSSESEPDGMPPRPNSAESVVVGGGRRRKGRKKEGHSSGNKKGNSKILRKNDFESRVNNKSRNASSSEVIECNAGGSRSGIIARSSGGFTRPGQSFTSHAGTSNSSSAKSRPRAVPYYWSEGDDEQEHLQQHGWIVGDSHKKLVTMLAHAKGRKRNNDEKRHVVE